MTRRTYYTGKRPPNRDSYQTSNYTNLVPQNLLQAVAQPQPTFVNAFRQNIEIDSLDPDQTIVTPEEVPPNAKTAARAFLTGLSEQETPLIGFYAEEQSQEQVIEARQRARAATDLVTRRKPPKHNNPPAQPMLAFDQVLADLETQLQQQQRLIQGTLIQIVKCDWIATLKFNLCNSDGHDRTREPTEDIIVTSNTSRVQQLNLEIVTHTTPDRESTSSVCRHFTNENCRFYRRTGLRIDEADCATSYRHDQVQTGDNATRMVLGSSQKTYVGNPTNCVFTFFMSITVLEPESIRTTQSFLQLAPSIADIRIIAIAQPLPIHWIANAIPDLTNKVPSQFTTESILTNDESTVNTNKRTPTIKQRKRKRLTKLDPTESIK
ncbi:MAG: hypothetical protein EZS28_015679 [Streblomastix strix]|uniref:Uncharacterized protein n=1 Tax=Streblomastix strix TaxID=222440 RepID=A0A5J4W2N2_9EUKA|nr:MAG: hypothetical protein EZS28_015679 [Streblomastix strix]